MPDIASLQDQHHDPVDTGHDGIERERCSEVAILTPNCSAVLLMATVCRSIECVICSTDNHEKPGSNCQDLVCKEALVAELFALRKRVVCILYVSMELYRENS